MAYCTDADIRAVLDNADQFFRDEESSFEAQIARAENWINPYLEAAGVQVPLSTAPAPVADAVVNYACFLLVRRVNTTGGFDSLMDAFYREAYRLRDDYISGLSEAPGEVLPRYDAALPQVINPHAANQC